MFLTLKARLKVSSVNSVIDPEGKENIGITFIQEYAKPPMVSAVPQDTPKQISNVIFQVQQGIKKALPRGARRSQMKKIVLMFTPEELEAFSIKPYPNQIYEITITKGNLFFTKI